MWKSRAARRLPRRTTLTPDSLWDVGRDAGSSCRRWGRRSTSGPAGLLSLVRLPAQPADFIQVGALILGVGNRAFVTHLYQLVQVQVGNQSHFRVGDALCKNGIVWKRKIRGRVDR